MPTKVNNNAPLNLDYRKGSEIGAAYRKSIPLKEAARLVKESTIGAAMKQNGFRFTTIIKNIIVHRKHKRSKFNTNPWLGNASAKANEFTIEPQIWRMISYSVGGKASDWFLAKHVGANNGFQFWHIENTASLMGVKKSVGGAVASTPAFDLVDDHEDVTMELPVSPALAAAPLFPGLGEVDDWEQLI